MATASIGEVLRAMRGGVERMSGSRFGRADMWLALLCLSTGLTTDTAEAQQVTLPPNFGTVTYSSGFLPQPAFVNLTAGGPVEFQVGACGGYFTDAPDFRVFFATGNQGAPLSFSVESVGDTVLLINPPDGNLVCNDDFYGLDPAISFRNPLGGQYDIWVGTFAPGENPPATLVATEFHIE